MNRNFGRGAAAAIALLWCRIVAAAHLPVVVELREDVPEIEEGALRDAVARELGEPVLLEKDATTPSVTVTVEIRRQSRELAVERRDATGVVARRVPLPADPAATLRAAVFLIGNLARDEASELIGGLRAAPPAAPEAAPSPAADAPPPEPAASPERTPPPYSPLWIGMSAEADFVVVPGADDVCLVDANGNPTNASGYACVDPNTSQRFPTNGFINSETIPKNADAVAGGPRASNVRLLASVDYAFDRNVLVGARAGYVLRTDPVFPRFPPLHLEARLTFVIGRDALAKDGLSPVLFGGFGAGEFDAFVPVTVNRVLRDMSTGTPLLSNGAPSLGTTTENAWLTAGPFFLVAGVGLRAQFGRMAIVGALKFEEAFGGPAGTLPGFAPELGVQFAP